MQISKSIYSAKNAFINNSKSSAVLNSSTQLTPTFTGLPNKKIVKPKAIFLALMTMFSNSGIINNLTNNKLCKNIDTFVSNSTVTQDSKFINYYDAIKKNVLRNNGNLFAEDLSGIAAKIDIKIRSDKEISEIISNLSKTVKHSKYYSTSNMKSVDYTQMINNNIPKAIRNAGADEIQKYKSALASILESCDEDGAIYIKQIPDRANAARHAQGINRLISASEKIQGCKFKNCSIFGGLSAEDFMTKIVIPNEKIAQGQKIGKNQKTLLYMIYSGDSDIEDAFLPNCTIPAFTTKRGAIDKNIFNFDESFLNNYDNVIFMQSNGKPTNETANKFFESVAKGLDSSSNTDIAFIGHGLESRTGVYLSASGQSIEKNSMDISDFKPVEEGGQKYAQDMKTILQNSINNGYSPRIIGFGCVSDFMQNCINKLFPGTNATKIKVFGSPYSVKSRYIVGFNNDRLEYIAQSSKIKGDKGVIFKLTESDNVAPDVRTVDTFFIDDKTNTEIFSDYINKGVSTGTLTKNSGVNMQYLIDKCY